MPGTIKIPCCGKHGVAAFPVLHDYKSFLYALSGIPRLANIYWTFRIAAARLPAIVSCSFLSKSWRFRLDMWATVKLEVLQGKINEKL
jgi:hypothetical protein